MHILIADDQRLFRELIRVSLASVFPHASISETEDFIQTLEACHQIHPQLIILDVHMPGMNRLEGVREIICRFPASKILICSAIDSPLLIRTILAFGANGYVTKNAPILEVLGAIETVLGGTNHVPELTKDGSTSLTARQYEILGLLCSGQSNKEIALTLGITLSTVKFHVGQILATLGVTNRQQAISLCGLA